MASAREPINVATRSDHQNSSWTWTSPVPYLFGGLAALLALIAFALLVLTCSYWKLSGHFSDENGISSAAETGHGGEGGCCATQKPIPTVFEEKFLVVMAGEDKPTFLATPSTSRSSSSGESKRSYGGEGREKAVEMAAMVELMIK